MIDIQLRKFVAPEYIFGEGARHLAGQYARNLGARKVLVVTDPGVMAAGWPKDVTESLEKEKIPYTLFSGVSPNPRDNEVTAGAAHYRSEGCNAIVVVGGGSPMDCAKGIGIVSVSRKHILTFEGVDQVAAPMPPLICIPTTAGTSADVSQFAIINDVGNRNKIAIISKAVVPDVSLIDPVPLLTMDPYLTACTGIDALVHAIEAFVSNANSPMSDIHALEAMRVLSTHLLPSLKAPNDIALRGQVMFGSLQAGLAFSNASLGGVHAAAHSLGGFLDLPHGECNAILLRHVMDFNFEVAPERYIKIGEAMGLDMRGMVLKGKKAAILNEIKRLKMAAGIESRLREKGVRSVDIPDLAAKAIHDPCLLTNPRKANKRDMEVIYGEAL